MPTRYPRKRQGKLWALILPSLPLTRGPRQTAAFAELLRSVLYESRQFENLCAKYSGVTVREESSLDIVRAVRKFNKRVCPLVCREGEQAEGDRCIAIAPVHKPEPGKEEATPKEPTTVSRDATAESFSIKGPGTIKHGQSVELTARDGRKMICVGGSIGTGAPRTCTWR
jgi:hypothetical protein